MTKDKMIGIRVDERTHARLHELAAEQGLSLTDFLVKGGLGELDLSPSERFDEIEARLARIESALWQV